MDRRELLKKMAEALVLVPLAARLEACKSEDEGGNDGGGSGAGNAGTTAGGDGTSGTGAGQAGTTSQPTAGTGAGTSGGTAGTTADTLDASTGGGSDAATASLDAGMDAATGGPVCPNGAMDTMMTDQHDDPHTLSVPMSDVVAGVEKVYSIKGQSKHDHELTLTSAHFATLASGGSVVVASTGYVGMFPHEHDVTVACG